MGAHQRLEELAVVGNGEVQEFKHPERTTFLIGTALAELEICLIAVGLLGRLQLQLAPPDQDLALQRIPSPSPLGGLRVFGAGFSAP